MPQATYDMLMSEALRLMVRHPDAAERERMRLRAIWLISIRELVS